MFAFSINVKLHIGKKLLKELVNRMLCASSKRMRDNYFLCTLGNKWRLRSPKRFLPCDLVIEPAKQLYSWRVARGYLRAFLFQY